MSLSREDTIQNLIDICGHSKPKTDILNAVRKTKSYEAVAKKLDKDETYCSRVLNEMLVNGLVQSEGKRGLFRQTPVVRKLNINAILRRGGIPANRRQQKPAVTKAVIRKVPDFELALDNAEVEPVIKRDCFPLKKPYRKDVGEAYLTLENIMKVELGLPDTVNGIEVVSEANKMGLFNRPVPAEKQGLIQLFNATFLWMRNPSHHRKKDIQRNDALKMILFADYLIKLLRKQKKLNKL